MARYNEGENFIVIINNTGSLLSSGVRFVFIIFKVGDDETFQQISGVK